MFAAVSSKNQWALLSGLRRYWFLIVGLVVLYGPTYFRLMTEVWTKTESFHGALFLLLTLWMVWSSRHVFNVVSQRLKPLMGWGLLLVGLFLFVIARSQSILPLEVISQLPVFAGILLITKGIGALRAFIFPILFLLFLVPLPGSILDALLMPLKQFVSAVVTDGLYALGYPIARNGVVIIIGPYHLLIADACAGLNSIIALSGIGLAYVYLAGHSRRWHNWLLILSVLPIAILANVVRVSALTLITYHFGDDMGQRFHDMAGMVEVLCALAAFFILDSLLDLTKRTPKDQNIASQKPKTYSATQLPVAAPISGIYFAGILMFLSIGFAIALTPKTNPSIVPIDLEQALPQQFGIWKVIPTVDTLASLTPANQGEKEVARVYDQSIMRTYKNANGSQVMLAVAWGRQQSQELKIHRPELCYTAQGFKVANKEKTTLHLERRDIPVTRIVARNSRRIEPITYWIRLGDHFSSGPVETRLTILKEGLSGNIPDGVLVRVSTIANGSNDLSNDFKIQQGFLSDLLNHLDAKGKQLMVGNPVTTKVALIKKD